MFSYKDLKLLFSVLLSTFVIYLFSIYNKFNTSKVINNLIEYQFFKAILGSTTVVNSGRKYFKKAMLNILGSAGFKSLNFIIFVFTSSYLLSKMGDNRNRREGNL